MITIYLIRHGKTEYNAREWLQGGDVDSPLTESGIANAVELGKVLSGVSIDRIYVSPLGRAKQTAELIRGSRPIELIEEPGLREMGYGDWDGLPHSLLEAYTGNTVGAFFDALIYNTHPDSPFVAKGWESFPHLAERTQETVRRLLRENEGRTIVLVTHGVISQLLLTLFQGHEASRMTEMPVVQPASLTELCCENGVCRIVRLSDTSHYIEDDSEHVLDKK